MVYVESIGQGKDLVLLHGWGLNSAVWKSICPLLEQDFRLHLVDLPGFGQSQKLSDYSLVKQAELVLDHVPSSAVWLGWSLGGLVATQAALLAPERVEKLITVASSPKFLQGEDWPGIKPEVLEGFKLSLQADFKKTVERFLAIQTLGSENARGDIKALKLALAEKPLPDVHALEQGLNLLQQEDLRQTLTKIQAPVLRIYGKLDSLVPRAVSPRVSELWAHSQEVFFNKASHAPFISHKECFSHCIREFSLG